VSCRECMSVLMSLSVRTTLPTARQIDASTLILDITFWRENPASWNARNPSIPPQPRMRESWMQTRLCHTLLLLLLLLGGGGGTFLMNITRMLAV